MADRLEQLNKLYAADPSDTFVTYALAMEHEKAGDSAAAVEWLDKTLALDPAYAYAYYQKGRLLIAAGHTDEARRVLKEGLAAAEKAGDQKASSELSQLLTTIG
jgi:tetratricopeptide (TPR) repeat protein